MNQPCSQGFSLVTWEGRPLPSYKGKNVETRLGNERLTQGRIQKIQKEGAEETDDAVLHHSGSICNHTLGLTLRTFQKYRK